MDIVDCCRRRGGAWVGRAAGIEPSRGAAHQPGSAGGQHGCLCLCQPESPDRVTLIANFIPLEAPYGGPNFFKFDDNVLYEIMVDNDGDAVEDITYQFRFRTEVRNPNTFLYNTGPITSLDSSPGTCGSSTPSPVWTVRGAVAGEVIGDNLPRRP